MQAGALLPLTVEVVLCRTPHKTCGKSKHSRQREVEERPAVLEVHAAGPSCTDVIFVPTPPRKVVHQPVETWHRVKERRETLQRETRRPRKATSLATKRMPTLREACPTDARGNNRMKCRQARRQLRSTHGGTTPRRQGDEMMQRVCARVEAAQCSSSKPLPR